MSFFASGELDRWLGQIESAKPRIRVGIYGAYFPERDHQILVNLRDRLRVEGFTTTYLVEDVEDRGRFRNDRFLKSQFSIEQSNVNLFVATFNGMAQGYTIELQHILRNPEFIFKSCILPESEFDENGNTVHRAVTSLMEQDISGVNLKVSQWQKGDFEDLLESAKAVIDGLYYYYLKHRPEDLR
jgi:hypothetical protein